MMGLGLKLLGIGKAILGFVLGVIKSLFDFAQRHPLLALALLVDVVLLYGCWWGYKQHTISEARGVQIVQLENDIKDKDSLIEQLYKRIEEYVKALTESQQGRVKDIEQHNAAVQAIKATADKQLAEAQRRAEETRKQRDYYFRLSEQYRRAGKNCGSAEQRIACEEALNKQFIQDMQRAR